MLSRPTLSLFALFVIGSFLVANAFVIPNGQPVAFKTTNQASLAPSALLAKKEKMDLSFIETRDMTKEEMIELNKKNEDIMNMELSMMTAFSLVLSLPILYLCWVAFFSE